MFESTYSPRVVMKLALVFLAVSFAFAVNQNLNVFGSDEDDFEKFKKVHKKKYSNKVEEAKRKNTFIKCRNKIKKHNKDFEKGLVSYQLRENHYCDRFDSELENFAIGNREPPFEFSEKQVRGKAIGVVTNTMFPPGPPSVDWTTGNCITPVKDLGFFCNSCWAFSAIAALEAHWCLKTGNLTSMSEQQLVDCNRNSVTGKIISICIRIGI